MSAIRKLLARVWKKSVAQIEKQIVLTNRFVVQNITTISNAVIVGGVVFYSFRRRDHDVNNKLLNPLRQSPSKWRFVVFASCEYDSQIYMTPSDFIASILEPESWKRNKRRLLTDDGLKKIQEATPPLSANGTKFFRNLGDNGIISYTEYLFLLSALIQPSSAVRIRFELLDLDLNKSISREECLVMEQFFVKSWKQKFREELENKGLYKDHNIETSLTIHLFGRGATEQLKYNDYERFISNFQKEINEIEFDYYSHGTSTMSEANFVRLLLKYVPERDAVDHLLTRASTIPQKGITFEEFHEFIEFVNNIQEFAEALKIYRQFKSQIDFAEFFRVYKKNVLSDQVLQTILQIFGVDGDGFLDDKTFMYVMKTRKWRGFKIFEKKVALRAFQNCMYKSLSGNKVRSTKKG